MTSTLGEKRFSIFPTEKPCFDRSGGRLEVILSTVMVRRVSCGTPGMPVNDRRPY